MGDMNLSLSEFPFKTQKYFLNTKKNLGDVWLIGFFEVFD